MSMPIQPMPRFTPTKFCQDGANMAQLATRDGWAILEPTGTDASLELLCEWCRQRRASLRATLFSESALLLPHVLQRRRTELHGCSRTRLLLHVFVIFLH